MKKNTIDIGLDGKTVLHVQELGKELTVLRMAFGRLKSTVAQAAAPLAAVFVPAVTQAVWAAGRLVKSIGMVAAALLGIDVIQTETKESVTSAAKAAKRSLADFDQIERLDGSTGASAAATVKMTATPVVLTAELQAIVDKIHAILEPLKRIDLNPAKMALAAFGEAFGRICDQVSVAAHWVWIQVLTPLAAWVMEELAPVLGEVLVSAMHFVATALPPLAEAFLLLWEQMQPVFSYIGQVVLTKLSQLGQTFETMSALFRERGTQIVSIFRNVGDAVAGLCSLASPKLARLKEDFNRSFGQIKLSAGGLSGFLLDVLGSITDFLAGAFTNDWRRTWRGITGIAKAAGNVLIGYFNLVLATVTAGLNALIRGANRLGFTVPDWVPLIGGQEAYFNIPLLTAPQIPYLAQGAVLPANKPFLAMVGDQRHGTNVEAPLATIQEAVAVVMGDQIAAMMSGFNALLEENRQLRRAVESIEVGDTVIGAAAERYSRKMAVVRGGAL